MKTIMGVKFIDSDDIQKYSGGHPPLCNHLKTIFSYGINFLDDISDDNKLIIDTASHQSERFNMLKQYKFIFVPAEIVHERFFAHTVINAMKLVKEVLIDSTYQHRADEVSDKYDARFTEMSDRYEGFDNIYGTQCYLFLFDDTKLEDIVIAYPPIVIGNIIDKPTDYHCSRCSNITTVDNRSVDTFLPKMRYEVINNQVKYYCDNCVSENPSLKKLKRVGE